MSEAPPKPRLALLRKVLEAGFFQALGMVLSILVIRLLSGAEGKEALARYLFALQLQGALTLLIDTGISVGLMSQGGVAWPDRSRVGGVFAAALRQRRFLVLLFLPPLAAYSLWQQMLMEASLAEAVLITAISLGSCLIQVQTGLHQNLLGLAGRYAESQRLGVVSAVLRLVLTTAVLAWISPVLALFANLVSCVADYQLKRRATLGLADFSASPDPEALASYRRLARALLPTTAFHILQSNLPLLIQAIGGKTDNVADFGALSRLTLPIVILGSLASGFLQPHFAKLPASRLRPFVLRVFFGSLGLALAVCLGGWLLRGPLLAVLGREYTHLGTELILLLAITSANFLIETVYGLCQARAWLTHAWIGAAGTIALQLALFPFFTLNTISGALCFGALSLLPRALIVTWLCHRGLSGKGLLVGNSG